MPEPSAPGNTRAGLSLHRLEAFSDAVFAFAVTLLVVSLSVPSTAQELFHAMHGFVAFGICFAFLVSIWIEHNQFFRQYPLSDGVTVTLNMVLLFVVLLYVYPMKFLFTQLVDQFIGATPEHILNSAHEERMLMIIYGLGFLGLNAVLALMRVNARRHGAALHLSAADYIALETSLLRNLLSAGVAMISILIAALTPDEGLFAGLVYFLLGGVHAYAGRVERLKLEALARSKADKEPLRR